MTIPFKQKLTALKGITFSQNVFASDGLGEPLDMTGYVARMQVRPDFGETAILDLSSPSNGIVIDEELVQVTITAAQTAALDAGNYKYDLEVESPDGTVLQLLYGSFKVKESITVE